MALGAATCPAGAVAGLDVSKRSLDVVVLPSGRHSRLPNSPEAHSTLVAHLRKAGVGRVVLEATGGLEYPPAAALAAAGFSVQRVNPERIWAWRRMLGQRAKTDRLDATLIARFAAVMPVPERPLPGPAAQAIRGLAARRRQLTEMIAVEKTRLKGAWDTALAASLRRTIALLEGERRDIEAALEAAIAADAESARRQRLLLSLPGVGPRIAATLVAEMPELGQLDRHATASLAGLAPHPQQSGTSRGRDSLRGGRPCVRVAFYMTALTASRHDPLVRARYLALLERGKPKKLALIAIARWLATTANQLIRNNSPWNPSLFP